MPSPQALMQSLSSRIIEQAHTLELATAAESWTEASKILATIASLCYQSATNIEQIDQMACNHAFEGIVDAYLSRLKIIGIRAKDLESKISKEPATK